ncbi:hypothetical protein LINPERPRIM_LOCUS17376 [Linum perenne]
MPLLHWQHTQQGTIQSP